MKALQILSRLLVVGLLGGTLWAAGAETPAAPTPAPWPDGLYAEIATPRGTVTCELTYRQTPLAVTSFVGLAEGTLGPKPRKPFFNGLTFHRVVPNFVVQGGDPLGTGEGDPGYSFPDEFSPELRHDAAGVLSMANDGPDTNGCQFFLTLRPTNFLNYLHPVFGHVVRGLEVLPLIQPGDRMKVSIRRIGAAARQFRADDETFARLKANAKTYATAETSQAPGPESHFYDPDRLLPIAPPRAKTFNQQLSNFERATGVRIVGRVFAKSPPAAEDAQAGEYMRALSSKLGTLHRGALLAYFADEDDWRVWIGDESTGAFFGHPTTPADLVEGGAFHHVKDEFLNAARARAEVEFERQKAAATPDHPLPAGQKLKLQVDAVLEGLFNRLGSSSPVRSS